MSPLIHFLIKQPALCLSHGLYLSPRSVLWADVARRSSRVRPTDTGAHAHPRTHSPLRCMKANPPGLDRNNKQQMIHDGDGECIQQDHLSDLI